MRLPRASAPPLRFGPCEGALRRAQPRS